MRTSRVLWLVSATIIYFTAPSAQAKPPVRVVSKELHCSLEIPDGWKRRADVPKPMWLYIGPMDKGFASNVSVTISPQSAPALPEAKDFFASVRAQFSNKATVTETTKTTLNGQPAYSCRLVRRVAGAAAIETRQLYSVYNSRIYVFTFTEAAAMKKKYDPIGDQMIDSFRFESNRLEARRGKSNASSFAMPSFAKSRSFSRCMGHNKRDYAGGVGRVTGTNSLRVNTADAAALPRPAETKFVSGGAFFHADF